MTVLCRDVSNYSDELTPAVLQAWRAEGVGLVICQAFPPSYATKYAEQLRQMRVCAQEGMPFDSYIYDYLGDPTWLDGALGGLTQAQDTEGLHPRKLWLDEEDTETEAGWTQFQRIDAISSSEKRAGTWAEARASSVGIYTAAWWWRPKTGNSLEFGECDLWAAQYDGIADASVFTPFGGWASCRVKQYAGSQPDGTDLNVLSVEEEAELTGGETPPLMPDCDYVWQDKKPSVVQAAGELVAVSDQMLAEANRKGGPRVREIRRLAQSEVRPRAETILA